MRFIATNIIFCLAGFFTGGFYFQSDSINQHHYNIQNSTPSKTVKLQETIMLEQDFNGHFWGNAIINNKKLPIMIDTGASTIAISKKDAKKLGISTKNLSFFQTAITAGGIIKYDIVTLKKFSFEGIEFKNIDIAILDNQTVMPLLGMNFLERLSKFEFKGSKVILHK